MAAGVRPPNGRLLVGVAFGFVGAFLIALSRNRAVQDLIVRIPASRRMARRFVAGETLADAIAAVLSLNDQGMLATLDHLGENVTSEHEARAATTAENWRPTRRSTITSTPRARPVPVSTRPSGMV